MTATETNSSPTPGPSPGEGGGAIASPAKAQTATVLDTETAALRDLIVSYVHRLDRVGLESTAAELGLIEQGTGEAPPESAVAQRISEPPFPRFESEAFEAELDAAEQSHEAGEFTRYASASELFAQYR